MNTSALSDQQRTAIQAEGGVPLTVVDEYTHEVYYLISADQFQRVRALLSEDDFEPREMYSLISKTARDAGWDDPLMDAYDNYDENRPQG